MKPGAATMVETNAGFVVASLADIIKPDPKGDSAEMGQARDGLTRALREDMIAALRAGAEGPRQAEDQRAGPDQHGSAAGRVTMADGGDQERRPRLAWWKGVADLETPVAAFLKLAHGQPNSFLLESIEGGSARGRYSVIGMKPDLIWRCRNGVAEINRHARSAPHAFEPEPPPALESLRALIARDAAGIAARACRR